MLSRLIEPAIPHESPDAQIVMRGGAMFAHVRVPELGPIEAPVVESFGSIPVKPPVLHARRQFVTQSDLVR